MQVFLKVKIKELAEEARIIRKEEKIAKERRETSKLIQLHEHRIRVVRPAARSALLAYGYLRGTPYLAIENKTTKSIDLKELERLVRKYGQMTDSKAFQGKLIKWFTVTPTTKEG